MVLLLVLGPPFVSLVGLAIALPVVLLTEAAIKYPAAFSIVFVALVFLAAYGLWCVYKRRRETRS